MGELRKDYLRDSWVIISPKRGNRPKQFITSARRKDDRNCSFCRGNESMTPPETYRVEEGKKWIIRCFPNKFPAVSEEETPRLKMVNEFLRYEHAYGWHEVMVDSPWHNKQLSDLPVEHIRKVLQAYSDRVAELSRNKDIKYVAVFKNYESEAGTSIIHSHSQLIAYNHVSRVVLEEVNAVAAYQRKNKSCPYCKIWRMEAGLNDRLAFENKRAIAFAPYASRHPYELALFPKRHVHNITELKDNELLAIARIIKDSLVKLKKLRAPYNMYLHNAPIEEELHFHIKINPRTSIFGGFELATGTIINTVAPEDAAKFYRGEIDV